MKKFAALMVMLSAISFAAFSGCSGSTTTDDKGGTTGTGSGEGGSGTTEEKK